MCELTVYDPRFIYRIFKLPDDAIWSSSDRGVLFFESDDYSIYEFRGSEEIALLAGR